MGTEVSKIHSNGSSPGGAISSQTRMTQTLKGSLLARGAFAWRQEGYLTKGQMQLRRTSLTPMTSGNLKGAQILTRPGASTRQRIGDLFVLLLGTAILCGPDQKVRPCRLAGVKKREHIRTAISNVNPGASSIWGPNRVDLAYPDIGFACFPFQSLMSLFSLGSRNTDKRFLGNTSQNLARLWTNGKHGLKEKSSSSFVADLSHTADGCRR